MPARTTRRESDATVRLAPASDGSGGLGSLGVDLVTKDGLLSDFALRRAERVRVHDGALVRAPGAKRVHVFSGQGRSRTFGTTAKYAIVSEHEALRLPKGGCGFKLSFESVVGSGATGTLMHGNDVTFTDTPPFYVHQRDNGVLKVFVNWQGGAQSVLTSGVLVDAQTYNLLVVYDPFAGTLSLYLDGDLVDAATGLASDLQPVQTIDMHWLFGVAEIGGVATQPFIGALDAFTLFSFAGLRVTDGPVPLLDTLRAETFRQWANPRDPMVRAQYDFDETSGTVLYDRSRYGNHGEYVGASTSGAALAHTREIGNFVGVFPAADGSRKNVLGAGGNTYYEAILAGSE